MKIKYLISVLLCMVTMTLSMTAQKMEDSPIKWRMTVKMTSKTEGTVTLRAIVSDGWHLYGTDLPKDGPIPTSFDFKDSKGVKFIDKFVASPKPEIKKDVNFGMELNQWESNVTFTRKFRLTGAIKDAVISGSVKFMGCNDSNCLPPKTVSFKTTPKPYETTR